MPEDLGQDFLNGYFAMNAKRQNQQNFQQELQMRKDQFAQTMQLNQQKFGLEQQQQQHENDYRDQTLKLLQGTQQREQEKDSLAGQLQVLGLRHSGAITDAAPASLNLPEGMPGPQTTDKLVAPGSMNLGGQYVRAITPEETAEFQGKLQNAAQQAADNQKRQELQDNLDWMNKTFPGQLSKDTQAMLSMHVLTGRPIQEPKNENYEEAASKAVDNWLPHPTDPNLTRVKDFRIKLYNEALKTKEAVANTRLGNAQQTDNKLNNDTAEFEARLQNNLGDKPSADPVIRKNTALKTFNELNTERARSSKPPLDRKVLERSTSELGGSAGRSGAPLPTDANGNLVLPTH